MMNLINALPTYAGYWILDARYWMLDTGYSILDTRYLILVARYWILDREIDTILALG